jgi:hypothetical protein
MELLDGQLTDRASAPRMLMHSVIQSLETAQTASKESHHD